MRQSPASSPPVGSSPPGFGRDAGPAARVPRLDPVDKGIAEFRLVRLKSGADADAVQADLTARLPSHVRVLTHAQLRALETWGRLVSAQAVNDPG